VPMPLVQIDGKFIVAYPYHRGYELGEYPRSYNNVLCMNINDKEIQPLPPAKWGTKWVRRRMVLDLTSTPGKHKFICEYKENSASSLRETFLGENKSALEGKFQSWLKDYKESNKLLSFDIKYLNQYDMPLQVIIDFENDDTPIPYGNKQIFQLKNFFDDYFKDITANRTEDVFIHNPTTYIDEIEVSKISGKKIDFDIKMEKPNDKSETEVIHYKPSEKSSAGSHYDKISSQLFSVDYQKNETDSSYIFKRTLSLKPIRLSKKNLQKVYNNCVKLNSIKNSNLIIY
jgi:hypothetical protein